jgi:hypothetical protein
VVALGIQSGIWGTLGVIVTFYFTTKSNDAATAKICAAKDELIAEKSRQIDSNHTELRQFRQLKIKKKPRPFVQASIAPLAAAASLQQIVIE